MPRWQNCMTSAMLVAMTALCMVRESPTLIGMVGSCGATPPASKKITRFGACVFWASIAAAQARPCRRRPCGRPPGREAQAIMSSMGV